MNARHIIHLLLGGMYLPPLVALPCSATTIQVPGELPTIQAGIDAAIAGDTVLVACGVYNEHDIYLSTSGIHVRSESGSPECVTIDALGLGRVFRLTGVDSTTNLEGLTITGGMASGGSGGGIYCTESSPTLVACHITDNTATAHAGGIFCSPYSSPRLIDCLIMNNSASWAGAVYIQSSQPTFANCSFIHNDAVAGSGGALLITDYCTPIFTNCEFVENTCLGSGGTLLCRATSNAILEECVFRDNSAGTSGGAVILSTSRLEASRCLFSGNTTEGSGGAIRMHGTENYPVRLAHCTMRENHAASGGAIHLKLWCSNVALHHCTLVENASETAGGVACLSGAEVSLENTIIAFSTTGQAVYCDGPDVVTLSCCDLYGNAHGDWVANISSQYGQRGNISEDPLFCGEQNPLLPYLLNGASPCAAENNPECGQIGAWPIGCGSPQSIGNAQSIVRRRVLRAIAPNPFTAITRITYGQSSGANPVATMLKIYDGTGRVVRALVGQETNPGLHSIVWDGRDDRGIQAPGGFYYCRLDLNGVSETLPVILIR